MNRGSRQNHAGWLLDTNTADAGGSLLQDVASRWFGCSLSCRIKNCDAGLGAHRGSHHATFWPWIRILRIGRGKRVPQWSHHRPAHPAPPLSSCMVKKFCGRGSASGHLGRPWPRSTIESTTAGDCRSIHRSRRNHSQRTF